MNPSSGSHNCRPDYPFNDPVTNSQNCRPLCASNHPVITFPSVGIIMTNSAHLMYAKPSTYACPFTRFLLNGPLYKLEPSNVSHQFPWTCSQVIHCVFYTSRTYYYIWRPTFFETDTQRSRLLQPPTSYAEVSKLCLTYCRSPRLLLR